MKATTNACKLPSKGGKRGYKYPKLEELLEHYKVPDVFVRASYNKNFPNKEAPAEAQYHNAAYDVCATHMVLGMGAYEDVKRYYGNSWFSAGTGA